MLKRIRGGKIVGGAASRSMWLAVLSGVMLGFSFPPFGIVGSFVAFLALIPLLASICELHPSDLRRTFWRGWLALFIFAAISSYWVGGWKGVGDVDPFLMVGGLALMIVHPFFLVLPILLFGLIRKYYSESLALLLFPFLWVGFEYWHSLGDISFPWLNLYNSQTYNLLYIQFIEITGPYGLSLVLVSFNVIIYRLFVRKQKSMQLIFGAVVLLIAPYVYGAWAMDRPEEEVGHLKVAIIQPNINPWAKWEAGNSIMDSNYAATLAAIPSGESGRPDLVLWPETAVTFFITRPDYGGELVQLERFLMSIGSPLLTGLPDYQHFDFADPNKPKDAKLSPSGESFYRSWNSAMLLYQDTTELFRHSVYHKQKLVPFGEHVPFVDQFPFLGDVFQWGVGLGSWNRGQGHEPLRLPRQLAGRTLDIQSDSVAIFPMICYESVYPSFVRTFVKSGANLLAIITNDGWYGKSSGPYQHNAFAVLRAIENRRAVIRSANTGISSVIDAKGRFVAETPLFERSGINVTVPLYSSLTPYTLLGEVIAIPCLILFSAAWLWFIVIAVLRRIRTRHPRGGIIQV